MSPLRRLRLVGLLEGLSLLALVLVAVPLKHVYGMPLAVRVVGPIHGALFLWFLYALSTVARARNWTARRSATAVVAALIPGGTLVFDRSLRRETESA
jgi:integral membrane protein